MEEIKVWFLNQRVAAPVYLMYQQIENKST